MLDLGVRLGKVAAACLVAGNFLYLFAPMFYFADLTRFVDTRQASGELVSQVSDPGMLASVADLVLGIGTALLAFALAFLLVGLWRARRRPAGDAFPLGIGAVVCLAGVPLVAVWTQARAGIGSEDAVIALGGWSAGSALLLAASLLFLFFSLRAEGALKPLKLACLLWPVYAVVNVLGAATFASLIERSGGTGANFEAFVAGLALKIILIPVLAVVAYWDLYSRLSDWRRADTAPRTRAPRAPAVARPASVACAMPPPPPPLPPPPPPEDEIEVPPLGD